MSILKPTKKQLDFLDWEFGAFFHFGIRTFYEGHRDWDGRESEMIPEGFLPSQLNCDQWMENIKEAGCKYAILTTKHHDGFSLWPSKYSTYSVKYSPYKDGKGDVVREFTDSCRKYGIKIGLYYSPAQFDLKISDSKEYDDYFINQITELLSDYGKIDYIWFDGCGSENHEYDKPRIIKTIRTLQPDIMIFSMWDPDTRWIGNEEGIAPFGTFYTVRENKVSINEDSAKEMEEEMFLPYECDCKIRREHWFYSDFDEHMLRSVEDLVGLYYYSIGRGGNLLLNIAPDRRGLLPDADCKVIKEFKKEIDRRFAKPVECEIKKEDNIYKIFFSEPQYINHVVLKENIKEGQRVKAFSINNFLWVEMSLFEGKAIGHKQICQFPTYYTQEIHIIVEDYEEGYDISDIKCYYI